MKSLSEILGWIRFLSDTSSFDCVNIFTDVSIFTICFQQWKHESLISQQQKVIWRRLACWIVIKYFYFWLCKYFSEISTFTLHISQQQKVICTAQKMKFLINPFSNNVPCLYPQKPENWRFSDVFRRYRSRTLVENGLRISSVNVTKSAENWRIWWYLLRKSLMENLIFCAVMRTVNQSNQILC